MKSPEPGTTVGILGAGRHALETAEYCHGIGLVVSFYVVDADFAAPSPDGSETPVLVFDNLPTWARDVAVVAAVGAPALRRRFVESWPADEFVQVIAVNTWLASDVEVGLGSTIAPGVCVSRNASIGDHVVVNLGSTLSHDVAVRDFATIGPGCHVAGGAVLGEGCFLGIGAVVLDGASVGQDSVVGAGAVVVSDVPDGAVVKGVPAR